MDRKESSEGKTVANKAVPNHTSWVWGSGQLPTASTFNFYLKASSAVHMG